MEMTPERREALRLNMYPGAHRAIEDWDAFHWHTYAASPRSSQMLAIDVFGTLKTRPQTEIDSVLSRIADTVGLPVKGPWQIELEWQDGANVLREFTPTQVDAVATSPHAMLLFECKFTEAGGGCSQTKPDRHGKVACNGSYSPQENPQNGITARCALSGKSIAYWDWAEKLYDLSASQEYVPCPFALDAYQWMRNSVLARAIAERDNISTRVLAVYADAEHLQTAVKVKTGRLGVRPLSPVNEIQPLSYQALLTIAAETTPEGDWEALSEWVEAKINATRLQPHASL